MNKSELQALVTRPFGNLLTPQASNGSDFSMVTDAARSGNPAALALLRTKSNSLDLPPPLIVESRPASQRGPAPVGQCWAWATRNGSMSQFSGADSFPYSLAQLIDIHESSEVQDPSGGPTVVSVGFPGNSVVTPPFVLPFAGAYLQFTGLRMIYTPQGLGSPGPFSSTLTWAPVSTSTRSPLPMNIQTFQFQPVAGVPMIMHMLLGVQSVFGRNVGQAGFIGNVNAITAGGANAINAGTVTWAPGGLAADNCQLEAISPGNPRYIDFLTSLVTGFVVG